MAKKTVSQKKFVKGVNAATGVLSQQPGALVRMSNLLLTQRGSLQTCDGSSQISDALGNVFAIWIDAFSNLTLSQFPYYPLIVQASGTGLANVTGFSFGVSGSASNPAGTYTFAIVNTLGGAHSSIDSVGAFQTQTIGSSFGTVNFNWTTTGGGSGYSIYLISGPSPFQGTTAVLVGTTGSGATTFSFTGVLPSSPKVITPIINTSKNVFLKVLYVNTGNTLAVASPIFTMPGIAPVPAIVSPGSPEFDYSSVIPGFTPYGGVTGVVDSIPMSLQFAGNTVLILGNGVAPQSYDPSTLGAATIIALSNTFQAAYPAWQSGVQWLNGSQLAVLSGGTNYLFTATQGGVSGTTTPTWNFTKGSTTADGSVIWINSGPIAASIAPRGAAHAVVYAGSLWLANTSPATTTDNIDGPTVLKMSDANNANSWNPVNTAFIGRDDGSQITGLATFTIAAVGISPTGSMAVFKEFLTYQIIGVFGSSNFEIQEAQTDMGCIASRSIQFIPGFGVVRYSHLGFAVYDGVQDRLISEELRPYLFGGIKENSDLVPVDPTFVYLAKSAQSVQPPMYMCAMPLLRGGNGALTRVFCYDLILKAWVIIDLPWAISTLNRVKAGEGSPLVLAGKPDGTVHRFQAGDATWDATSTAASIGWGLRTPDVFGEGSSQRLFYREMVIRGWATAAQSVTVTAIPTLDGAVQPAMVGDVVPQSGNQFEVRFDLFLNGQICHLDISGSGQVVIDSIDWTVNPKSTTARRIIG